MVTVLVRINIGTHHKHKLLELAQWLLALSLIYSAGSKKSGVRRVQERVAQWTARTRQGVMVMVYHGARVYILIQDTSSH